MSVIEVKHLVKKYGDNIAVNDLSLTIEKGKVYGFLGPNGAGKSTTMNIITGYTGATSGTVIINGHDIFKEPEEAKKCFGYLPEVPPVYPEMTVDEYLKFVSELKKIPKKQRKDAIEESVRLARVSQVRGKLIKNLSKGYKQRVGIAQAVMGMPDVIILDEPTVGLDPKQIIEIRELITQLGKKHTVILSSHILTEISEVCEHIFIISQGRLVASGSEEELVRDLAGDTRILMEVKGLKSETDAILRQISHIKNATVRPGETNGCLSVEVTTEGDIDIREELFFAFAKRDMPILSMRLHKKTLEDIFIELTADYVAPEKKRKKKPRSQEREHEADAAKKNTAAKAVVKADETVQGDAGANQNVPLRADAEPVLEENPDTDFANARPDNEADAAASDEKRGQAEEV